MRRAPKNSATKGETDKELGFIKRNRKEEKVEQFTFGHLQF